MPRFIREEWEEEAKRKGMEKGMKEGMKEGLEKGQALKDRAFTFKTLQKFPEWSDAEVAEFVGVSVEYVQNIRSEIDNAM